MKVVLESALNSELDEHLGYEKNEKAESRKSNTRNGYSKKMVKGDKGEIEIKMPRDREASFEPAIVPKGKTRLEGFEDNILALYARGMTTRDIQDAIKDLYHGAEISHSVIANVTDAVIDEVTAWQNRPLDSTKRVTSFLHFSTSESVRSDRDFYKLRVQVIAKLVQRVEVGEESIKVYYYVGVGHIRRESATAGPRLFLCSNSEKSFLEC